MRVSEGTVSDEWERLNFHTTDYGYSLAGDLTTVTDPAGNVITYGYDKVGRRTSQNDPDSGAWSYSYDDVGNQLTVTDALSHTITTDYDALNRPTLRHEGATNLASWVYDATSEKGLLDKSTRHTTGGDWVTDVVGYDMRNRPTGTKLTVPAGIPGLSGDYITGYGYNLADQRSSISYPAVGGLTAETVTTGYHDTLGLPATLTATSGYSDTYTGVAFYDDRARPLLFGFGLQSGNYTLGRTWTYNADQRLAAVSNAATGGLEVARHDMAYDQVGNITARTTKLGTNNFRECFRYDDYQRLVRAVTTTTTTDCSTNPTNPAGNLPYEQDFTHSPDGNLLSRDDGAGPVTYTYPTTGTPVVRPHAPTSVGSDTYTWDANGNLDTRTVGGVTTDLVFDHEHNLASATTPDGTSTYVYDAGGQRLYQNTPDGSTLYLEGQEVTATPGGSPTVTATRLYTFGGQLVATRTAAGGVDYMVTDHQGSVEAKVDAGGTIVSAQRAYKPYGQPRTTDTFATQRGWIGQIEDTATNLNYLNARYYDPNLARFISPDPLYEPAQIKSLNPYTYAWANPVNGSDPSGLRLTIDNGSSPETAPPGAPDHRPDPIDAPDCSGGACGIPGGGGGGSAPSVSDEEALAAWEDAIGGEQDFDPNDVTVETVVCESVGTLCGWNRLDTLEAVTADAFERLREVTYGNWVDCATKGDPWSSDCGWVALDIALWKAPKIFQGMRAFAAAGRTTRVTLETGEVAVYVSRNASGAVNYVGITNNIARRASAHSAQRGIQIRPLVNLERLSRSDARAVEQVLIEEYGGPHGGQLLNKINSIAESNPIYPGAIRRGCELLTTAGYNMTRAC